MPAYSEAENIESMIRVPVSELLQKWELFVRRTFSITLSMLSFSILSCTTRKYVNDKTYALTKV